MVVKARVVIPPLVVRERLASPFTSQQPRKSTTAHFTMSLVVAILACYFCLKQAFLLSILSIYWTTPTYRVIKKNLILDYTKLKGSY